MKHSRRWHGAHSLSSGTCIERIEFQLEMITVSGRDTALHLLDCGSNYNESLPTCNRETNNRAVIKYTEIEVVD
jgi:hypothetical protein